MLTTRGFVFFRTKANKSTDAKSQKVLQKEREEIREIVSQLPMFEGENSGVWDSDLQYVRGIH